MALETGCSGSAEIIQNFPVDVRYFARRKLSVANYKKRTGSNIENVYLIHGPLEQYECGF